MSVVLEQVTFTVLIMDNKNNIKQQQKRYRALMDTNL